MKLSVIPWRMLILLTVTFQNLAQKFKNSSWTWKLQGLSFQKKNKNNEYYINNAGHVFFLSPTESKEVSDMIANLDDKKSPGPNGIPILILKKFKEFFSIWLAKLINLSFETGVFPDLLKFAKITPLHKKESKLDFHNYRPISLLSVYSKLFEKLIYSRVYAYLVKFNLISSKQFGFRSKHSCNHAIISLTEHVKKTTWWWSHCMRCIYWFRKSFWYCSSWYSLWQVECVWPERENKWSFQILLE